MSDSLPETRRLWRYTVFLDTEGGERKLFKSVLLTKKEADRERIDLINDGHKDAEVEVDKEAALAYQNEKDANRKNSKPKRGGSHG